MIASWPAVIKSGTVSNHTSAFYDFMPTLADIVDVTLSVETDGISYYPTLKGELQEQHDFLYWEYVPSVM
jgi:arylsulfatase A-like enzyme